MIYVIKDVSGRKSWKIMRDLAQAQKENFYLFEEELMEKLVMLFSKLAPTLPLILFLCFAINCQPNTRNGIAEKETEMATSYTTKSLVGAVGLPKQSIKLVKKVNPIYPDIAKKANVEGSVILEVTFDINGKAQKVKLLRSIPLLDQAAIDAVKQWIIEPLIIDGQRRGVIIIVAVPFELK